jgi:2-oxoglutarate ferredoxin oxidoreductase subunit gamma
MAGFGGQGMLLAGEILAHAAMEVGLQVSWLRVIVVNASMVPVESGRDDCTNIRIRARELAIEAGNERAANFVMLGAYVGATAAVPDEAVETAIENKFTGGKARFVPGNQAAFRAGLAEGRKVQVKS